MSFNVANLVTISGSCSYLTISSNGQSTSGSIVDLAPYMEVGKRPVKVVCSAAVAAGTTLGIAGNAVNVLLYQSSSTASAFATCSTGSTGWTSGLCASSAGAVGNMGDFNVIPTQRYVMPYFTFTSTAASQIFVHASVEAYSRSE